MAFGRFTESVGDPFKVLHFIEQKEPSHIASCRRFVNTDHKIIRAADSKLFLRRESFVYFYNTFHMIESRKKKN